MTYNDPSHLPETNPIDQAKVDALSKEISKWLQTKMYGVDVRTALAWAVEHFSAMHYDENVLVLAMQRVVEEYKQHFDQTTAELGNNWTNKINELNKNWQHQLDEWNRIIAGVTTDTEIKDARVDRNGNHYATLKERLDASQTIDYANTQEVIDGYFNNKAISPKSLKDALPTIAPKPVVASTLEARAAADNTKMMTPARVKDSILDNVCFIGTQSEWEALTPNQQSKYVFRAVVEDGSPSSADLENTYIPLAAENRSGGITAEMYRKLVNLLDAYENGNLDSDGITYERKN